MRKTSIICILLILIAPSICFSYTVFVSVDNTLDFTKLNGFQFDITGPSVNDLGVTGYAYTTNIDIGGTIKPGAIPNLALWAFDKVITPTDGISGYDLTYGSFPLTPGVILGLVGAEPFSLTNFRLSWFGDPNGKYPSPFNIIENPFTGGKEYIYSQVPIPAAVWLLGSGIVGLVALKRRKKA